MVKATFFLPILIAVVFTSCIEKEIDNIEIEVKNDSNGIINKFCLNYSNGEYCISNIKINETKKIKMSVMGDSTLYLTYDIDGITIYDKFDIETYISSIFSGYFHFIIKNKTIYVREVHTESLNEDISQKLGEFKYIINNHKFLNK